MFNKFNLDNTVNIMLARYELSGAELIFKDYTANSTQINELAGINISGGNSQNPSVVYADDHLIVSFEMRRSNLCRHSFSSSTKPRQGKILHGLNLCRLHIGQMVFLACSPT